MQGNWTIIFNFTIIVLAWFSNKNNFALLRNPLFISQTKIEKMLIKTALERSNGKKNDAAQILGWGRNTLSKKMKEHGI